MPINMQVNVDVYLVNSKLNDISEFRRKAGVFFLNIARWLLKSELRVEEAK